MGHRFNPGRLDRLNDPEREKMLPPDVLWEGFGAERPGCVVDVGAGTGFFAVRFIARLAPGGTIWACDTDPFMVAWMREHLSAAQLERVTPLQTGEHEIALPDASADLAYLINVYHDVEDAPRMLQELRRLLKPGAPLAVVDWKKETMPHGPAIERRVDGSVIRREMERAGFGRVGEAVQLPFHVFLSGRREPG